MIHHIITNKGQFIFIPVENDAYRLTLVTNSKLENRYGFFEWTEYKKGTEHRVHIPSIKDWDIFADTSEMTEEKWSQIVDKTPLFSKEIFECYTPHWKTSRFKGVSCKTATNSGYSLLESRSLLTKRIIILKKKKKYENE